ncbi:MAG: hypothetical protein RJA36_1399 [Pseudomonadota bacterium]|jgi:hypothetical protein
MPRFRVSYTFVDTFQGDVKAIASAVRDLLFSTSFNPQDLNDWGVFLRQDGTFRLEAKRTLVDEFMETSERAALRKFLYGMDLPDTIDVKAIKIECLTEEPAPATEVAA